MNRSSRLLVAVALFTLFIVTFGNHSYAADAAPDFKIPTAKGMADLSKLKGKVVYVDFWASWCVPCRKSFPWMNAMHKKYKDQGLEIIAVNLDKSREPIDEFLKKLPADFTIAYDPAGTVAEAYGLKGMPSTYIIDRTGVLQFSHIGFREKDQDDLENKIKELLARK